jgi:hypothetical protein
MIPLLRLDYSSMPTSASIMNVKDVSRTFPIVSERHTYSLVSNVSEFSSNEKNHLNGLNPKSSVVFQDNDWLPDAMSVGGLFMPAAGSCLHFLIAKTQPLVIFLLLPERKSIASSPSARTQRTHPETSYIVI